MTHHAERALFELTRGRPLLVEGREDAGAADAARSSLVAAVEPIDRSAVRRLERLGDDPVRLVVTASRARSLGLLGGTERDPTDGNPAARWNGGPPDAVALPLGPGPEPERLLRLTTAPGTAVPGRPELLRPASSERAGLELTRLAGLLPAVLAATASPGAGTELDAALDAGAVLRVSVAEVDALAARSSATVRRVSEAPVPLEATENARFLLFREEPGLRHHVAVVVGEPETWPDPVPVRLHSACLTGDLFGSLRCDCGEQLRESLGLVAAEGGVLLYLDQEGRGIGLANKLRAYAIQETGLDTVEANRALGFGTDERRYETAVEILRRLGVERVRLLTNNPAKLRAVEAGGLEVVERRPLHGTLNRHNLPYVAAKVHRIGHWLEEMLSSKLPGT